MPRILQSYGEDCFVFSDNFIRMVFPALENAFIIPNLVGGLSGGVKLLLNYIEKNPVVKASKLSQEFDLPQRTVERWLKKLKEEKKIEYKGSAKTGGYWLV
ncbi:MAG: hypothetical protein Q8K70_06315 [Bacteroidota bacterium]|nr:hypothetical protein [Bacteroidota bacterium]